VSEDGDAWFDLEAEHDMRLTQRMYLQPRFEAVVAAGYGETADMARADGEPTDDLAVVAGIRAWF